MQCKNTDTASKSESGSWLVDMILSFDRKSEKAPPPHNRGRLPLYEPTSRSKGTCLYLAYGSNMCASVFQGNRGIQPISSVHVVVPELRLCWNVEGIPYVEPCYANAERRLGQTQHPSSRKLNNHRSAACTPPQDEGLVGVVYEISAADFAHVLRTEGQGYADIEVDCFPLQPNSKKITRDPNMSSFRAHAVLAADANGQDRKKMQPSNRYLNLLVTGAKEHGLPSEYITSLQSVSTYEASTLRQRIGKVVFSFVWFAPVFVAVMLERRMADENGRIPGWVNRLVNKCFSCMWWTHAYFFKPLFGNGACNPTLGSQYARID